MTALDKPHMSMDEYLAPAIGRPGRYELFRSEVFVMAPEPSGDAETTYAVQAALLGAIRSRNLPCHMLPDGMTVRIDAGTACEPDAVVFCGPKIPPKSVEIPEPMILVEVLSPSTRHRYQFEACRLLRLAG
jgi:Uma2 family endonuclease